MVKLANRATITTSHWTTVAAASAALSRPNQLSSQGQAAIRNDAPTSRNDSTTVSTTAISRRFHQARPSRTPQAALVDSMTATEALDADQSRIRNETDTTP